MPRKKVAVLRPRGLTHRSGVAYWQREHARLPAGRVNKSLETRDGDLAQTSAAALNTLVDRGDWGVIARWVTGDVHITDIVRAVREGDYKKLHRLNSDGLRLQSQVDAYLTRSKATLSVNRYRTLQSACAQLVGKFTGDLVMHDLTSTDAEGFLHELKDTIGRPWAPNSQSQFRTIFKALWTYAMDKEAEAAEKTGATVSIVSNPWKKARVPKKRKTRFAYCQPTEAFDIVRHPATVGLPRCAFMAIGFYTGLRVGEICHLRPGLDVDLDGARIIVQSRKTPKFWRPKTENGERTVPLPPELVAVIREHVALGYSSERYLFVGVGREGPINTGTARAWAKAAYESAGLRYGQAEGDGLTMHSTRHSYATWLLSGDPSNGIAPVPLATAAKLLGDTPATVVETYAHVMPQDETQALAVIMSAAKGRA